MKNYKNAVPVALVILMVVGIYVNVSGAVEKKESYQKYLEEARKSAELGVVDDAIDYYDKAREVDDSLGINLEEGNLLVSDGRISEAITWGEGLKQKFSKEPAAYNFLLEQYMKDEDYESCFKLYDEILNRGVKNSDITENIKKIQYVYDMDYDFYDEVGVFANGYAPVCYNGKWGYVNEKGKKTIKCQFAQAGIFTGEYAAVQDMDGEWYYITTEGKKKFVVQNLDKCTYLGPYIEDIVVACGENGFGFYDIDFQCIKDSFEELTAINGGVAAGRTSSGWQLFGKDGKALSKNVYEDVIVDEKNICYRNDRVFAKKGDGYIMLDGEGKEITPKELIEDAKPFFEADGLAAVKVDGKWGFMDKDGNMVIEAKYRDARSTSNGYAAVKKRDKWGYITAKGKLVIDCEFDGAKEFTSQGTAMVKSSGYWKLMKLYKDNH